MKPPIIVLGMHRSGTSLLTGCLEAAGLFLGTVNNAAPFNKKGNKENESIRELHDSILMRHGFDWKTPPDKALTWTELEKRQLLNILKPYNDITRPWGFKDPRIIWLIEGWLEIFPGASLVAVFRHPLLVSASLANRPGGLSMPINRALHLWCVTNRRILDLHHEIDFPLLEYGHGEALQSQFFEPLSAFARQHGLTGNPNEFYDSSLTNQIEPVGEITDDVLSLYEELITISGNRTT
ncbi:sulfotransferase [Gammaproteobacteria bacterium]|nr:sulfotransferase [Gammaproteobacteria bacterium]